MAEAAVVKAKAQMEAERKARAEAEERAKTEAVARVVREQELRENAEKNVKSRVEEELRARARAEAEADARYRAEAEERAKAAAADRKLRMESEARDAASSFRAEKKPGRKGLAAVIGLVVLLAGGLGALQLMPLAGYVPAVEELATQRLGQPVRIANMRYTVYPEQVLRIERISIGNGQQIKADNLTIPMMPWSLLLGEREFDTITANAVSVDASGMQLLPALAKGGGNAGLRVRQLRMTGVKVAGLPLDIPQFDATLTFGSSGAMQRARMTDGKMTVDLAPKDGSLALNVEAREWRLPVGPALLFSDLSVSAQISGKQITVSSLEGRLGGGRLKGALKGAWSGSITVEGEFNLENSRLQELLPAFTRDFSGSGSVNTNGSYALQGKDLDSLFDGGAAEAAFTISSGELNNVDVVRAIQSPTASGTRGGKTRFDTLSGALSASGGRISYKQLQLTSGPLNASGVLNVGADGALAGRINAELGSRGLVVARGNLGITGAVRDPLLRP